MEQTAIGMGLNVFVTMDISWLDQHAALFAGLTHITQVILVFAILDLLKVVINVSQPQ